MKDFKEINIVERPVRDPLPLSESYKARQPNKHEHVYEDHDGVNLIIRAILKNIIK